MTKARVLYDFVPSENGDLGIVYGEMLEVIQDLGNGWSRVKNQSGLEGLVPTSYIEVVNVPPMPNVPPPNIQNNRFSQVSVGSDDYQPMIAPTSNAPHTFAAPALNAAPNDDDDSDTWSTDSDDDPKTTNQQKNQLGDTKSPSFQVSTRQSIQSSRTSNMVSVYGDSNKMGNIRMPKTFLKTGGEEFLFGTISGPEEHEKECDIEFEMDGNLKIPVWRNPSMERYALIKEHTKKKKFKGMKLFVEYKIENNYSQSGVIDHRYKQFDWLQKHMVEKFLPVVIPPLPTPKVVGRFEEDFVESRQKGLQRWLNYIVKHPVLKESKIVHHFMEKADTKDWKQGKRENEDDKFKGAKFFLSIRSPDEEIVWKNHGERITRVIDFQSKYDASLRCLHDTLLNHNKKQKQQIKKLYSKMGGSFKNLFQALSIYPDNTSSDVHMYQSLEKVSKTYDEVGCLFEREGQKDVETEESLEEQMGISKEVPGLLDLAKGAVLTVDSGYRKMNETKTSLETMETVDHNMRIVAYAVDAELSWLQEDRERHLKGMMHAYLSNQVELFEQITNKFKEARDLFA